MFGASLGALIGCGQSGVESFTLAAILPLNAPSGCGQASAANVAQHNAAPPMTIDTRTIASTCQLNSDPHFRDSQATKASLGVDRQYRPLSARLRRAARCSRIPWRGLQNFVAGTQAKMFSAV